MSTNKFYLEKNSCDINEQELKEDFLKSSKKDCNKSLDKLCLSKTTDIATLRKKSINSDTLEKLLQTYRNIAINKKNHS